MNLNKVFLIGRVVREPEQRSMPSGSSVTTISLATNRKWKNSNGEQKEESEFHNCTAFGKTAETIATYVKKGQEIMIEGRIKTDSWEKDGIKRYTTKIIIETFQFGQKPNGTKSEPKTYTPKSMPKVDSDEIPVIKENGINVEDINFED